MRCHNPGWLIIEFKASHRIRQRISPMNMHGYPCMHPCRYIGCSWKSAGYSLTVVIEPISIQFRLKLGSICCILCFNKTCKNLNVDWPKSKSDFGRFGINIGTAMEQVWKQMQVNPKIGWHQFECLVGCIRKWNGQENKCKRTMYFSRELVHVIWEWTVYTPVLFHWSCDRAAAAPWYSTFT